MIEPPASSPMMLFFLSLHHYWKKGHWPRWTWMAIRYECMDCPFTHHH